MARIKKTGERRLAVDREASTKALGLDRMSKEEKEISITNACAGATETARRRKAMREIARTMLDTELQANDELRQLLDERGFKDFTESAAVLLAQLNRARNGDTDAAKFLRDTSGERPADQIAIGNLEDRPFETLDLSSLSDADLKKLIELRGGKLVFDKD